MFAANKSDNSAASTLKIGVAENPPLVILNTNKQPAGFMIDYINAIKPALPRDIEFLSFASWEDLLTAGIAREVDVIILAQKTRSRLSYFDFTHSIITVKNYLITRADKTVLSSLTELNNYSIAAIRQSANESFLVEQYSGNIKVVSVDGIKQALMLVEEGKVDAAISSSLRASHYIQEADLENLVEALDTGNDYELSIATRNDQPELNILFEQALKSLNQNELDAMRLKWGLVKSDEYDWQLISIAIVVILILIALVTLTLISNLRLKREIKLRQDFEQQLAAATANIQSQRNLAQKEARTDPLTGVNNRRKFDEYLNAEMERFKRNNCPFCLMIIDLDYFKMINDEFGHDVGDQVLIDISQEVQKVIRPYDHFGRVGGEEFAVILPDTKLPEAETIGERILEAALSYKMESLPELAITVSIGLSQVNEADVKLLYKQADQALYASKENGRNRLTCFNIDLS
ncbi:MAG: diguanylate cyclase [Gammaproteobacteria bacterium]|nr:diguanylate cyclase [Gammaproteobacteria bacterium]